MIIDQSLAGQEYTPADPLFALEMHWGQQPVRLTARCCATLPTEAPVTSVHIVPFQGERVLVVRDRRGVYGFPGGRLEKGESLDEALARELHEEARAHLKPGYTLFASLRIECTTRLPNRVYPNAYSYMALYVGALRRLEPIGCDPAGTITARALFTPTECERELPPHDRILLREAISALRREPHADRRTLHAFAHIGAGLDGPAAVKER